MIRPSEGARFTRLAPNAGVERVQLTDGALDLEVRKLQPGERFLVTTADAEVEVRGTVFRVEASSGHITAVTVREGKVEVRHLGDTTLVPAGGAWHPHFGTATVRERTAQIPGSTPAPAQKPSAREQDTSRAFAEGMSLVERGDYAAAAERLEAFRAAHPDDARAEDAAYLVVLSLQRAGRKAAAAEAARRFLSTYPGSPRKAALQDLVKNP